MNAIYESYSSLDFGHRISLGSLVYHCQCIFLLNLIHKNRWLMKNRFGHHYHHHNSAEPNKITIKLVYISTCVCVFEHPSIIFVQLEHQRIKMNSKCVWLFLFGSLLMIISKHMWMNIKKEPEKVFVDNFKKMWFIWPTRFIASSYIHLDELCLI